MLSVVLISHFISLILDMPLNTEPEPGVMAGPCRIRGYASEGSRMDGWDARKTNVCFDESVGWVFTAAFLSNWDSSHPTFPARLTLATTKKTLFLSDLLANCEFDVTADLGGSRINTAANGKTAWLFHLITVIKKTPKNLRLTRSWRQLAGQRDSLPLCVCYCSLICVCATVEVQSVQPKQ